MAEAELSHPYGMRVVHAIGTRDGQPAAQRTGCAFDALAWPPRHFCSANEDNEMDQKEPREEHEEHEEEEEEEAPGELTVLPISDDAYPPVSKNMALWRM